MLRACLIGASLALLACAPTARPSVGSDTGGGADASARKSLTVAIQREPAMFHDDLQVGGAARSGGVQNAVLIVHEYLMAEVIPGVRFEPRLASEAISVEKGTWRVRPDGAMETTWKLRPNVRWHDGRPFSSDDLVFSFGVYKDPEVLNTIGTAIRLMDSVAAPDPNTLVVYWSAPFLNAATAPGLIPMPRHLLEDLYVNDKANFLSSPRFTTSFVGLGPYRLQHWELGSHIEFSRFEDYYSGRPRISNLVLRFISDSQAMVASALAGAVDAVLPTGVELDAALDLRQRWEGTGNQVLVAPDGKFDFLEIQHRPEYARPPNGLTNQLVRQALYQATDRQVLAEVLTSGLAPVADSWFAPTDPLRPQVESAIPQFPFDRARAQELLSRAGWLRTGDGTLVGEQGGEAFDISVHAQEGGGRQTVQNVVADSWKAVGARVAIDVIPVNLIQDNEYAAKLPGARVFTLPGDRLYTDRMHSGLASSPANRWTGNNRGGYANPRADSIYDRMVTTIDERERIPLHRELLQELMGDVALMPTFWRIDAVLVLKGVTGIDGRTTWNVSQWDRV